MPERFNIGVACSDVHPGDDVALVEVGENDVREWTFGELSEQSNRCANALAALGVEPGARVAFVLPQGLAGAVMHLGVSKLGAVAMPLSALFGPDALRHRLADSGARVVVTSTAGAARVEPVAAEVGVHAIAEPELAAMLVAASPELTPHDTAAEDPAYLIYTSGTTASPKGVLHAHRSLFGHLPCLELGHDRFPQPGDRTWTPADWSWIGGMMDAFLPSLYFGVSVVAAPRPRFDPQWAARLIVDTGIRNAFVPPTALRLMKAAGVMLPPGTLRSVISGGETLGADVLAWARESLGVTIAEMYGQSEANLLVGNAPALFPPRPGSMGRPYPGHDVEVLDDEGQPVARGVDGEIALRLPDPVAFLGYVGAPEATAEKTRGGWLRTGDIARRDEDGYIWFLGRADDLIISAGYRISPLEVEQCLLQHEAVASVAVVGAPDATRGQIVKAFVVPAETTTPGEELVRELQAFVRERLAAYEYPRAVEFVDELPQTVTGKIRRAVLAGRASEEAR
ncbi:MAG: AMP-binding protein [Gaiellaceae bacterium]